MRHYLLLGSFAALLLLGCQESSPRGKRGGVEEVGAKNKDDAKLDDAGGDVRFASLTMTAPKGWGRKTPQSTIILAEYVLPRVEGDSQDGRLTLSTAGGSVEENINRWKKQFGGKPEKSHQEKIDVNGLSVTLVDFTGEYNDQRGPNAPAVMRPDYRMIGAIIPVNDALHFVKAVGPKKTIEDHAEKLRAFIKTAKK
jgi:hypothetical protein